MSDSLDPRIPATAAVMVDQINLDYDSWFILTEAKPCDCPSCHALLREMFPQWPNAN